MTITHNSWLVKWGAELLKEKKKDEQKQKWKELLGYDFEK